METGKIGEQEAFHQLCDQLLKFYIDWSKLPTIGGTPRALVAGTDQYGEGVCLAIFNGCEKDLLRIKNLLDSTPIEKD